MTGVLVDAYQGKHEGLTKLPVDLEKQAEAVEKTSVGGGIEGLYQGLEMKIVKGFLSQGVTFLVKGRCVVPWWHRNFACAEINCA